MKLVFELADPQALRRGDAQGGVFDECGGMIGRDPECAWSIEDTQRHVSGRHAEVSWRDGSYFLTDVSRNGTRRQSGEPLPKGDAVPVRDGDGFRFGGIEIIARLTSVAGTPRSRFDALELDPLATVSEPDSPYLFADELSMLADETERLHQAADHAPASRDHLLLPRLVAACDARLASDHGDAGTESGDCFWQRLSEVLGLDLQCMAAAEREAVMLKAAGLLRECVDGLQRTLRNRDDLHADIGCATQPVTDACGVALDSALEGNAALHQMLTAELVNERGRSPIGPAFQALQAHQVAMLSGARAAARAAVEHFSPQQLNWEFERDSSRPVISTAGGRWRAYLRFHHALSGSPDWADRLLARHFTQAYQDQIRLTNTLHLDPQP